MDPFMKRVTLYTKWIIVGFILVLLCLFHTSFLTLVLNTYTYFRWGETLTYEKASVTQGCLILTEPRFSHSQTFAAKKLSFRFSDDFWKGQLYVQIEMSEPVFRLDPAKTHSSTEKQESLFLSQRSLITLLPHLKISGGSLLLEERAIPLPSIKFDAEMTPKHGIFAKIYCDPQHPTETQICIKTETNQNTLEVACEFSNAPLSAAATLSSFADFGHPALFNSSGVLQGKCTLSCDAEKHPRFLSTLTFHDVILSEHEKPLHGNLQIVFDRESEAFLQIESLFYSDSQSKMPRKDKISISLERSGEETKGTVTLDTLSPDSFSLLQSFTTPFFPDIAHISLTQGTLSAILEAWFKPSGFIRGNVSSLKGEHLAFTNSEPPMEFDIASIDAKGTINSLENPFSSLSGEIHVEGGTIQPKCDAIPLSFKDVKADITLVDGKISYAQANYQCLGLKGHLALHSQEEKTLSTLKLEGHIADLLSLLPKNFDPDFRTKRVLILSNIEFSKDKLNLDGTFHVQKDNNDEAMDLIHFGGTLKRTSEEENIFHWIPEGWFHAQRLSLNKYLSPFIFKNEQAVLNGFAEIQGTFSDNLLQLKYDTDDLQIENEHCCFELASLHPSTPGNLEGTYEIDFNTFSTHGKLPIDGASYLQKNKNLFFYDILGSACFENGCIKLDIHEVACEGVHFGGELIFDYKDPRPGVFDLYINTPTMSGKFSEVKKLLGHFEKVTHWDKIPLEGDIIGRGQGLQMQLSFLPDDYNVNAHLTAVMTEGEMHFEEKEISLKEIDMDIEYDHSKNTLALRQIQGSILCGKARHMKDYLLVGSYIDCMNLTQPEFKFDLQAFDKDEELFRLRGHTHNQAEGREQAIEIDRKSSHFSGLYLNHWVCTLKDWSEINQFDCRAYFDVKRTLKDLSRFKLSEIPFVSHMLSSKMDETFDIEGRGSCHLKYQTDKSLSFHFETGELKTHGENIAHIILLKGNKQNNRWIIDQFQWDDLSIYAEVTKKDDQWKIPFLGMKLGQGLLLGLDGGYWNKEKDRFVTKLKYCQIDLKQLDSFSYLQPYLSKWQPEGILRATGELEIDFQSKSLIEGIHLDLMTDVSNLSLRKYPLTLLHPFSVKFISPGTCTISNAKIEIGSQKKGSFIELQSGQFDCKNEFAHDLNASFEIKEDQFSTIVKALHHYFPESFDTSLETLMTHLRQPGEGLRGDIQFSLNSSHESELHVVVDQGHFPLNENDIDLKNLHITLTDKQFSFSAETLCQNIPCLVRGEMNWPQQDKGQLVIIGQNEKQPFIIKGEMRPGKGWTPLSVTGDFAGCSFALTEKPGDDLDLEGEIFIDIERFSSFLAPHVAKTLENLSCKSLIHFVGTCTIDRTKIDSPAEAFSFQGEISSQDFSLKGFQFEKMKAQVRFNPPDLNIENWVIQDKALQFHCPLCHIQRDRLSQNAWVSIPSIEIKDLKLNLLKEIEETQNAYPKFRLLNWEKVIFQDIQGNFSDKSSWDGKGWAHFVNPQKKNIFTPLFAIPSEIILRLGLDPHVLNPVTGTIEFQIMGDRVYLTKLKDVYSEGRGSKFYLADTGNPSWIDFDGNLSINIRMNQYNLIFKIAELFTVTLEGNINKPIYSLQKMNTKTKAKQNLKH